MSVNAKMTAIADAIRNKTESSELLTLDDMASAIDSLECEELIQHAEIPLYVKNEVLSIANKVQSVKKDDSIIFLAMSDNHHYGEQQYSDTSVDSSGVQTNTSNLHGAMGAKSLAYLLDFDFMAHLGDATWGGKTTTSTLLNSQCDELFDWIGEAHKNIPCFHAIGNHDTGIYYHEQMIKDGNTGVYTESGSVLYEKYTALSDSENTVFGDTSNGGYCYRDFPNKKLRVFLLNTSEKLVKDQKDQGTYGAQRVWFANALLDLNNKTDASEWGFIVLSHYPADYGANISLSELLKAYVEGASFAIKDPISSYFAGDGTNTTVSFSSKNKARFIAQFHGHVHNFLYSKLYSYATGSGVQYDAWRICVPNGQYNRENYYTTVGSYTDINFKQDTSYPKIIGNADDTSFVVNVINPSEEVIHSFCYGAGYDRTIGYAKTVYYNISYSLSNITMKNGHSSIEENGSYTDNIIVADGYELKTIKVTMGGVDITSSCYSDEIISIDNVTGDIVITAVATEIVSYKNELPISTDASGAVYNGTGYKANTYLSGGNDGTRSGIYASGFIPCKKGDILRFKNCHIQSAQGNHRFALYDANKTFITNGQFSMAQLSSWSGIVVNYGSDGYVSDMTMGHTYCNNMAYVRFCCSYLGADSIVTVNEPIE